MEKTLGRYRIIGELGRALAWGPDMDYRLADMSAESLAAALVTGGRVTVPDWPEVTTQPGAQLVGVDVRLILPSRTDSWLTFHAGRSYYEELLEAGIEPRTVWLAVCEEYDVPPARR